MPKEQYIKLLTLWWVLWNTEIQNLKEDKVKVSETISWIDCKLVYSNKENDTLREMRRKYLCKDYDSITFNCDYIKN